MNHTMAYTARNQVVLQAGAAKRDIAFYLFKQPWSAGVFYDGADLRAKGRQMPFIAPSKILSHG
jgi:hypothetical protein